MTGPGREDTRLAEALAAARARLELTEQRAARMQELSAALAAALTPAQVAAAALAPAVAVLGAGGAALILRERDELSVAGTVGYPAEVVEPWRRIPLTDGTPAGRAVLTGRPCYVRDEVQAATEFPAMLAGRGPGRRQRSWAAVPLRAGGEVIGAFAVGFGEPREFGVEERGFLETVAAQCTLALERSRLYETASAERERLEAVLARLPAGVVIGEAPSGRLVLGNAELERIWRQPFRASTGFEQYRAYRGFHPDGRRYEPQDWPLARSLGRGEVVTGEEVDFERGDGTRGTMVVNSAPIHDADGTITAAVCTFVDITERTEARRRLDAAYAAERQARAAAEAAGERLGRLQQITAGLAEALTVQQVAAVIVRGGLSVAGCRSAWIGVLDETGEALVVLAASFPVEPDGPAARIPLSAASPRAEVTRTGQPVWLSSAADALGRYPALRAIGIADGALGVVPLVSHGRPIGAMMLSFADEGTFNTDERALITTLAEQCAQALERARLQERSQHVALALQQSMLPSALPDVDGLELTARYHPAVKSLEVGGDWYDVLALPDGRVAVTVGDVVGRGLGAASAMGQLRSALAALALSTADPGAVLDGLERFADRVEGARLATVLYALLDPVDGTIAYSSAGHLPPLLVDPDGRPRYLTGGRSPLLCARPRGAPPRGHATETLPPGGTVLLYTDGLVERRGESLDVGLDRLSAAAAELDRGRPPGEWCDALLDALLAGGKGDDDVALLGLRYAPVLTRVLPARPEELAGLREDLRRWLAGVGATREEVADMLVAAGEACANAVEHAYDGGPGELVVQARLGPGRELTLTVRDRGHWRTVPAPGDRGRGLPLMRALADSVAVAVGEGGTVVTLRRTLGVDRAG
ncbi:MAG TPA: SpoIIE family protein phosphatase [Mycobacteriales bacterium]